jgi:mono/diheme cytochrome c family protein
MTELFPRFISAVILCCMALPSAMQAQSDAAKLFKTNCVQCHSANGSGDTAAGSRHKNQKPRFASEAQKNYAL